MKKLFSLLLVSVLTTAIASAQDVPPPPPAPQGDAVPPAPRQEKPAPDATPAERKMSPRKQNFLMWRAFSQLSEEERAELDYKQQYLATLDAPTVTVTYFVPDERKTGGAYVTHTGTLKRIDEIERTMVFNDGVRIPIVEIISIGQN